VAGSPFLISGLATEKARRCLVAVSEWEQYVHFVQLVQLSGECSGTGLEWWSNRVHASMEALGPQYSA